MGEFCDLPAFSRWLESAGQAFVQILPISEIPETDTSPYSALTSMALDPTYISLPALEDFQAIGGEGALSPEDHRTLEHVRRASKVEHRPIRELKARWLHRSCEQFTESEYASGSERSQRFEAFMHAESSWLNDYALFQALRYQHELKPWWGWPAPLAHRNEQALREKRDELRSEIHYRKYVQWVAAEQWAEARRQSQPLQIFGDVPFMISADSPDVWTQQAQFRFDATVGVPPDAFSETGQDWGLPPWRWEVMAQDDFEWMKRRARRTAALFDGFRLDHLVGLYRTYVRPRDGSRPFFAPEDQQRQLELGERLVGIYQDTGAEIVAEDLGTVPDFVRASLLRLGVPGFKVQRWERHWHWEGQPYIDPPEYPETSVATTGTHDTEPLVTWWESLSPEERDKVLRIPSLQRHLEDADTPFDALLQALLDSRSRIVIIPMQDVFGWKDRVNTPATVADDNWTWRMPWPVDRLDDIPDAKERAARLATWTRAAGRS